MLMIKKVKYELNESNEVSVSEVKGDYKNIKNMAYYCYVISYISYSYFRIFTLEYFYLVLNALISLMNGYLELRLESLLFSLILFLVICMHLVTGLV